MRKYRIVKRGDTETYLIQERFLRFFWHNRMGDICTIHSVREAREYVKIFEDADSFSEKAKKEKYRY